MRPGRAESPHPKKASQSEQYADIWAYWCLPPLHSSGGMGSGSSTRCMHRKLPV